MGHREIVNHVNKILEEYPFPLTVRQIFYRLVSEGVIPNTVSSYKMLSKILVRAREQGDIDDSKIEDRSRQVLGLGDWGYDNIEGFIESQVEMLKRSWMYWTRKLWTSQPKSVVVVLEKDALSRLVSESADKYRVQVFVTRGYGSYTYVKDLAKRIGVNNKPTVILYLGDYDPSGRDIERDLTERLRRYGAENFEVRRVALTKEQIHMYSLPPRPEDIATLEKLERDPRTRRYGMDYACELDALDPRLLQTLIEDAIVSNIDMKIWNETLEKIEKEKEELKQKLERIKIVFES